MDQWRQPAQEARLIYLTTILEKDLRHNWQGTLNLIERIIVCLHKSDPDCRVRNLKTRPQKVGT